MTTFTTLCRTPSKLILSGEHAVVYGAPALSIALDLPTFCKVQQVELGQNEAAFIEIHLPDYNKNHRFTFPEWRDYAIEIEAKYQGYLKGNLAIENVLSRPVDLIICTLFHFNQIHRIKLNGWHIKLFSQSLIGKGLGSSASVIISLLHSLYKQQKITIDSNELLEMARKIECRQHGQSSGLDTATVFLGGLILFQNGKVQKRFPLPPMQGTLLDTGSPSCHTGQVVTKVKQRLAKQTEAENAQLWQTFSQVTLDILEALKTQKTDQLRNGIRRNQHLLETLGVVPETIQTTLSVINQTDNCAAKVCGAGSISGDSAGIVLLLGCENLPLPFPKKDFELNLNGSECEFTNGE